MTASRDLRLNQVFHKQNLRLLCLSHPVHPLRDHRKSLPAALALVDDLFYGGKRSWTLRFLTDFLQERVHLAKNEQHLVPNTWRKKQFLKIGRASCRDSE